MAVREYLLGMAIVSLPFSLTMTMYPPCVHNISSSITAIPSYQLHHSIWFRARTTYNHETPFRKDHPVQGSAASLASDACAHLEEARLSNPQHHRRKRKDTRSAVVSLFCNAFSDMFPALGFGALSSRLMSSANRPRGGNGRYIPSTIRGHPLGLINDNP